MVRLGRPANDNSRRPFRSRLFLAAIATAAFVLAWYGWRPL